MGGLYNLVDMGEKWQVIEQTPWIRHVIPLNDADEHCSIASKGVAGNFECVCDCGVRREYTEGGGGLIFIHSSFDGREGLEWAADILK
jgi:hypothetical protein